MVSSIAHGEMLRVSIEKSAEYGLRDLIVDPPKANRAQHLVAIVADNDGAETTDFIVPYGVLKESGVVDVVALSTREGPISLHPALTVKADKTIQEFDEFHPEGADIVIVPAMHHPDKPTVIDWLKRQYRSGATIVSICDGIWVLGHAGLLDEKTATGHWYSLQKLRSEYPRTKWLTDRRYVADGNLLSTTGVSASIPASLALVKSIAGDKIASELADRLGVDNFDPHHDTSAFENSVSVAWTAATNWLSFWNKETIGIPIDDDIDEIALSLTADAWSRTFRSKAKTVHSSPDSKTFVKTRRGLWVKIDGQKEAAYHTILLSNKEPAKALDTTLVDIAKRYGSRTADFVALQLEYNRDYQIKQAAARIQDIEQQATFVVDKLQAHSRRLMTRVQQLEEELKAERKYKRPHTGIDLIDPWRGASQVYAATRVIEGENYMHLLCSTCFENYKKRVLTPYRGRNGWIYLECRSCNALIRTGYQWIDNSDYFARFREFGALTG